MPKQAMNYDNAVIYKIVCNDLTITDCYVGSTTNFIKRKYQHKCASKINTEQVYKFIRENGDWDNWSMVLVEEYPTTSYLLLGQRERYWIETLNANLNFQFPTRTDAEYYQDHKEHLLEYQKQYYELKKEEISKYKKQYREQNKELLKQKRILRKNEKKAFSAEL